MTRTTPRPLRPSRRLARSTAVLAALALLTTLAACGGDPDPDSSESAGVDLSNLKEGYLPGSVPDPDAEPVAGGSVKWAAFAEPASLDPKVTIAALTTGGVEMLNIYDTLLRYDTETQDFAPQLAEGIESDDNRTWTLTLRDDVTFSDGTPLDAAAVQASQERYADGGPESALWNANVRSVETPDDQTVVYTLEKPWAQFPGMLTTGPGMIVAASAGDGESFEPVGAGPFTLEEWRPQESIRLAANADYWAGKPALDSLEVVFLPSPDAAMDSFDSDSVDMIFVREPDQVQEMLAGRPHGYVNFTAVQNSALINASKGRPGADVRVRQALQLAIDPQVVTERAFGVAEGGSSTVFPEYSRWHGDASGLPYDPERAKQLLEEARADGFDGRIRYEDMSDPGSRATALALKALWESVGFEVETHLFRSVADMITAVAVERDYDVVAWGHSFREADPLPKMYALLHSGGSQTYDAHTSPEMDALLDEFQVAPDFDAQHAVMQEIQEQIDEEVPFLALGPYAELLVWHDELNGVVGTANSMVSFAGAWKD
ncbi:ABC transporter substrate-binding protein [Nocardioides sp. YIM 152315]|uniref:ABC transporter substrate-binding protein n=1 Tax=Nocardioides sp. YIM 152315 TaxID=3031760 RepID=UPI0023DA7648|nr:ABC transporter substrate-binding protein [Nocardioides sp. YIM 152315]MDF1604651.1 ABC transporter substrate-binding protein [Nocardioides sp. YIM 152315]